jgi:hypothetical protein
LLLGVSVLICDAFATATDISISPASSITRLQNRPVKRLNDGTLSSTLMPL